MDAPHAYANCPNPEECNRCERPVAPVRETRPPHQAYYRAYDRRDITKYYRCIDTPEGLVWQPENGRGKSYKCHSIAGTMGSTSWGFSDPKVDQGRWQPMNPYGF